MNGKLFYRAGLKLMILLIVSYTTSIDAQVSDSNSKTAKDKVVENAGYFDSSLKEMPGDLDNLSRLETDTHGSQQQDSLKKVIETKYAEGMTAFYAHDWKEAI